MTWSEKTKIAGCSLLSFDVVDSTNLEAKRQAEKGAPNGLLVVAEKQEAGRGRRGRSWDSPAGSNIFMSLLLRPSFSAKNASMTTLVMALAVAQAITDVTGLEARIKWPNDIVINGKKTVGILTELALEENNGADNTKDSAKEKQPCPIRYLVCGVGINVNQKAFSGSLADTATSLYLESGKETERGELAGRVIQRFWENYAVFCRLENMAGLLEDYNSLLVNYKTQVKVLDPNGQYEGVSYGINERGELIVKKEDGSLQYVYAGEVSVRGIYGYV